MMAALPNVIYRLDRQSRYGFTLIELIMVIVIISVLSGFMTPLISGQINRAQLEADIQKLFYEIRSTQQLAMTREDGYGFYGIRLYDDLGGNNDELGYRVLRYEPKNTVLPITDPPAQTPTIIKSADEADNAVVIEKTTFNPRVSFDAASELTPGDRIIFRPEGSATTDGVGLLVNTNNQVTLTAGNRTRTLTISPVTGKVKLEQ